MIGVGYVIFLFVMGLLFYNKQKQLRRYGYFGIFLIALISNISMFSPGLIIASVLGGRVYNPAIVGVIAALGCVLGEIIAYQVGSSGTSMVQDKPWFNTVQGYMEKHGALTIVAVTAIPQPIANVASLIAGVIHYPFFQFLLASFVGNWIQHFLTACFGKLTKRVV